ncbi:MAG: type II toxin-antitoxin system Phd/YefM family antitoxin [Pseudomonadota bacterium]|jgi:antitoxin Phd|uniref:Antitoxin n=1 Tax=Banduia mediterranea TaxID=3075609 RepID=A0ABU2WJ15_9GAMM|nr:type II toxin-antitoxin system Phd/YefM family antitoxin [Algiphilus sp. W345]MCH9828698.1 type II toxin-antitoxin system Phd/YefM family antitoxin [Gammaproteobacteria bacterium]MDT0497865.1 type II toxin-antitoxin system Phd/YefM family antitoxin [Algiphilus sp. W345]MEC9357824.1 type II toxin-antitoxin system Phd/YefM family antitoxin [Pseudomonadota bacterium]
MKTISIADARNRFTALIREAERGTPVQLSRRGTTVAVLLSAGDYQRLQAAAANASDFAAWAQAWRQRLPTGFEGVTPEEVARWRED